MLRVQASHHPYASLLCDVTFRPRMTRQHATCVDVRKLSHLLCRRETASGRGRRPAVNGCRLHWAAGCADDHGAAQRSRSTRVGRLAEAVDRWRRNGNYEAVRVDRSSLSTSPTAISAGGDSDRYRSEHPRTCCTPQMGWHAPLLTAQLPPRYPRPGSTLDLCSPHPCAFSLRWTAW